MAKPSATSELTLSMKPPDDDGVRVGEWRRMDSEGIPVDLAKRLLELQAQTHRNEDENRRLLARNLETEGKNREQRRSLEEKDEQIIRLEEELVLRKGSEARWKEKYERLYEKYESDEAKWKEKVEKTEEKCWKSEVDRRKLEIDLEASGRRADELGEEIEKLKKAVEELRSLVEEKDVAISEQKRRNEELERWKRKMEEELGDRLVKLKEGVEKCERLSCEAKSRKEKNSGDGELKGSDRKSIGISILDQGKENLDAGVHLTCTPKPTHTHVVQISDDESEEKDKEKQIPSFATPKCPVTNKRKSQPTTCFAEKQAGTKRCKSNDPGDGKLWKTAVEMQKAFETDQVLCMKSVCALYRKHESLGVWKFCLNGSNAFMPKLAIRGVALGKLLTAEDPDGKMHKSLADLEREDPRGIHDCRLIAEHHHKLLFDIYSNNLDPFFLS